MFDRVMAAFERIRDRVHQTPVMTSETLDRITGATVFFKCENLQKMGAFKFRGALNSILQLSEAERARGIVTYSSGNHAQAVALVGRMLDIRTTVVMPEDAPATKRAATEAYGARVIAYDPAKKSREEITGRVQAETGCTLIPPFDHREVVAGQGTATVELIREVGSLDMLLVPCGGGGLLSGSAIAAKGMADGCRVVGIEPELADDATRSFHTRTLHRVDHPPTIADGTRTPSLGKITFPLVLEYADDMKTVTEESIKAAVRFLFYRMKLVVEPSGALGAAALLSRAVVPRGRVGVILSGGNIDGPTMTHILQEA